MQPQARRGLRRTVVRSFGQGARLGALVTGLVLMVALIGASEVAGTASTSNPSSTAQAAAQSQSAATTATVPTAVEVDRHLLGAARARQQEIRELVFQLSVAPIIYAAVDPDGIPSEPPLIEPIESAASVVAPVASPRREPRIVSAEELRNVLGAVFGDQAETAYSVVMCESAGNGAAHTGNGYYGLWQFDLGTWASVGGSGYPSDASVGEQVQRAKMLHDSRGWQPWGCHPASRGGVALPVATEVPDAGTGLVAPDAPPAPSQPSN